MKVTLNIVCDHNRFQRKESNYITASANFRDILTLVLLLSSIVLASSSSSSAILNLYRVPTSNNLTELHARDMARYEILRSSNDGVISFPLGGTLNPNVLGIYYTKVQLGTPSRDFYVFVDTGSYISWVSCITCINCPKTTAIPNISVSRYDPGSSSSASFVSCTDKRCNDVPRGSKCSTKDTRCGYSFNYQDNSRTSGYLVEDLLTYARVPLTMEYTTPIIFGCTTFQSADLMRQNREVDGIFGFGRQKTSLISQLASRGLSPWVFSHCLSENEGGVLVFGAILDPSIVYSPLVHSSNRYNLNLKFISVNGRRVQIHPSIFTKNKGATVDSGTSLAFLPSKAYNVVIGAIDVIVSANSSPQIFQYFGRHCYIINSSVTTIFPQVTFTFEGEAALFLDPLDYMVPRGAVAGGELWCMGFTESDDVTILGEIFMKNKFFIYDLAGKRIGWTNYNCSSTFKVSTVVNGTGDATRSRLTAFDFVLLSVTVVVFLIIIE